LKEWLYKAFVANRIFVTFALASPALCTRYDYQRDRQNGLMDRCPPLVQLADEWSTYLEGRGHKLGRPTKASDAIVSRNGQGNRYRWIFLHVEGATGRLTAVERENIRRELQHAKKGRQQAYVVIKFERPFAKLIVMPASKASGTGRLRSDKGGIPWNW
jgi:hypothetical protein